MVAIDEMLFCVKEGKSARHRWRRSVKRLTFKIKCFFYNHLHLYRNGVVMGFGVLFLQLFFPAGRTHWQRLWLGFYSQRYSDAAWLFPGLIHAFWVQLRD
jgi:hypothetical protein